MVPPVEKKSLTKRQELFVDAYLQCFSATEAARRAGYKNNDLLHTNASKILHNTTVKQAIDERLAAVQMTPEEVLKRLADIARGDIADFLDVSPLGFTLDLQAAHAAGKTGLIKKIKQKTITINGQKEDREIHTEEIELYSSIDALQLLGKHHKLFNEVGTKGNPVHIEGLEKLLDKVWS
jgi:phage terminase small subunit